jgi:hypothetical protein
VDSVIVFFGKAPLGEVEPASLELLNAYGAAYGESAFLLLPYGEAEQIAELAPEESARLIGVLGGRPRCAIQIACKHGQAAQVALHVASQLMSQFEPSALDDDFGGLWSSKDVAACLADNPPTGIYALRERSILSLQRTAAPYSEF